MTDTGRFPDFAPPRKSKLARPFYEALDEGVLKLPGCAQCQRIYWYPPDIVPCHPDAGLEWRAVSPVGVVYSFTTIERSLMPGARRGCAPHTILMVEPLDAPGARLIGLAAGEDPEEIACGDRVRFHPLRIGDHVVLGFLREDEPAPDGQLPD